MASFPERLLHFLMRLCLWLLYISVALKYLLVAMVKWIMYTMKYWKVKSRPHPPAVLMDPKYGEHVMIHLKDVAIHCISAGEQSRHLILFLHGFPGFWYSWRHQIREFQKKYWVVAVDLRGYGDSEKPNDLKSYRIDIIANDILQLLEKLDVKKCVLVGHDWGGMVGWKVVSECPDKFHGFIAMNCPHPETLGKSIQQFFKSLYILFFQIPYLPEIFLRSNDMQIFDLFQRSAKSERVLSDEDLEAYKYTFGKPDAFTYPLNYYRNVDFLQRFLDGKPVMKKIRVPTLLIWGTNDVAFDNRIAELSESFVERFTLKKIANCNHFVQEDDPETVNSFMKIFLQQIQIT